MAIMIFCQNLGGAVFLTAAQPIFSNVLRDEKKKHVPGLNATFIIAAGARSIRVNKNNQPIEEGDEGAKVKFRTEGAVK